MHLRRSLLALSAVTLVVVPLAACSKDHKDATPSSGDKTSTTAKPASDSSSCNGLESGKDGIVRVFCDGKATAHVSIGGVASTLTGGSCNESGGYYTINFGAVAGPDFTGARPDYLGALIPDGDGPPQAVTIRSGGAGGGVQQATASVSQDKQSVHLAGTVLGSSTPVSADIGCG